MDFSGIWRDPKSTILGIAAFIIGGLAAAKMITPEQAVVLTGLVAGIAGLLYKGRQEP